MKRVEINVRHLCYLSHDDVAKRLKGLDIELPKQTRGSLTTRIFASPALLGKVEGIIGKIKANGHHMVRWMKVRHFDHSQWQCHWTRPTAKLGTIRKKALAMK